jgi:TRAP-type C4-dicarboxylate transport system permease small subunit
MRVASRMAIAAAFLLLGIWVFELGQGKRVEFTPVLHLPLAPVAWAVAAALVVAAVLAVLPVFAKTPPGY